jgi:parallel beta-helix repeat protein
MFCLCHGIFIQDGIDNIFTANTCSGNSTNGINLVASSSNVLFSRNTFLYNTLDGNATGMIIGNTI